MSRIGIKPITVPENVSLTQESSSLTVKSENGQLQVSVPRGITVVHKDNKVIVTRATDEKQTKALHGTVRSLVANAIQGVHAGFAKKMELVGIGYRAAIEGDKLTLQVGFTHPVVLSIPEGLSAKVEKSTITISGIDKQRVGQFSAEIRAVRPPEPYKGKGIRYSDEIVRLKQGKAVKAAG